jgi:hypothetical protein
MTSGQAVTAASGYFLLPWVWIVLVVFPLNWLIVAVYWLARLNLFLLDRLKFKGLLLSIGAVMFLFAKGILAIQALPETSLYHFFVEHAPG